MNLPAQWRHGQPACAHARRGGPRLSALPAASLFGLPGVATPADLQAHWHRVCRPRIEQLQRRVANAPPGRPAVLLPLVDELICELKQAALPALHCSERDAASPEWRAAGADVASAVRKYEQHVLRDRALRRRLREAERTLRAHAGTPTPTPTATAALVLDGAGREVGPQELLHLARALGDVLDRQGAGVQAELGAVHCAAPFLPGTEDPAWQEWKAVAAEERALAARVRAAVADPTLSPALPLASVAWHGRGASVGADDDDDGPQQPPPWASDPILQPLLRRTPRLHAPHDGPPPEALQGGEGGGGSPAGGGGSRSSGARSAHGAAAGWGAVLLLDSLAVSRVMALHADPTLRAAVHALGAQPRLEVMVQLRARMASARARLAHALGAPSYAHLADPAGAPERVGAVLRACLEAVRGLADAQVRHMEAALAAAQPPAPLAPSDAAYAQHVACAGLRVDLRELQPFLSLEGVVEGLGDVLLGSMGLRLRILPSCACPEGEGGGNLAAACDGASGGDQSGLGLWRHRVALESCSAGEEGCRPLGLIYLDPGGGGGTRQLRFVRRARVTTATQQQQQQQQQGQQEQPTRSVPAWDDVPIVAVGLQQPWAAGVAGGLDAVVELLHEAGHAVHILASSVDAPFKVFGGLHLTLLVLEVPSILFERFLMDPRTVQAVCRRPSRGTAGGPTHMDMSQARRVAAVIKAEHSSALDLQEQLMVALADHTLDTLGPGPSGGSAGSAFAAVWEQHSSLPVPCAATLKRLSSLPVAAHHQATFWCYALSWCVACAAWERYLAPDPLGRTPEGAARGRALRQTLLEAGACAATNAARTTGGQGAGGAVGDGTAGVNHHVLRSLLCGAVEDDIWAGLVSASNFSRWLWCGEGEAEGG